MNYVGIIIGICMLGAGIWITTYQLYSKNILNKSQEEFSIDSQSETPNPTVSSIPSPTKTAKATYFPPKTPTNTPNTRNNVTSNLDINSFRYPESTILSSSNTYLELQSSDNPNTITNWYKEKIKSTGMNATSFVTTNTNGIVLNKLVASGQNKEIRVEIKTTSSGGTATVIVKI